MINECLPGCSCRSCLKYRGRIAELEAELAAVKKESSHWRAATEALEKELATAQAFAHFVELERDKLREEVNSYRTKHHVLR